MDELGGDGEGPQRLALLASALAGRTVAVREAAAGEPAWTDGVSIFVDPGVGPRRQLESVTVQASLLAGGGLAPEVVGKLARRPTLARRYLAIEGRRALAANEELLPSPVRTLLDPDAAVGARSPAESLAMAGARGRIADPPECFGTLKPRHLVSAAERSAASSDPRAGSRTARLADDGLDGDVDDSDGDVTDPFSSPVGGGGAAAKLLQHLMSRVRQLRGGGPPGADAPTNRSHRGIRGAGAVMVTAAAPSEAGQPDTADRAGRKYPEWDVHRRRYRPDWCTVHETEAPDSRAAVLARPDVHSLRRPLMRLGVGLNRCRRQTQGDDIDVDAAVEARVELLAGSTPDEAVYLDSLRRRRDLAVLILLDVSGSAAEAGTFGQTVHEQQRAAAAALTVALHELGDRVALFAFHSQGRGAVNLVAIKRFDDALGATALRRLAELRPGAYSRLGAAIRHGTAVIAETAGTTRRLLVVLSDGLAYDHGYERGYGAADARRALGEARRQGIGCLCLTIGAATDAGELRQVFGNAAHAAISKPAQLGDVIGPLFRAALRTADMRRRIT